MTASKISKAAQGTIGVIMRLALVICLRVSTQKQLFTFSNIVLCHLVLSRCLSPSLPLSPSLYRFLTSFSGTRSRRLLALLITKAFPLSHASCSPACLKSSFSSSCRFYPALLSLLLFFLPPPPTRGSFSPSDLVTLAPLYPCEEERVALRNMSFD